MLDFRDGDIDPIETREWVDALQSVLDNEGSERLHFLLERLTAKARELGVSLPFDFGGSIRAAALAMGGDWHDLGGALSDDAIEPVALQPLAAISDPAEQIWAAEWVAAILSREGVTVTPEAKEHLWSALTSLASAPLNERTLTVSRCCSSPARSSAPCSPIASAGPGGGCSTPRPSVLARPMFRPSRPRG